LKKDNDKLKKTNEAMKNEIGSLVDMLKHAKISLESEDTEKVQQKDKEIRQLTEML